MDAALHGAALSYEYQIVDMRSLDGDTLLASPNIGDNVLAVLGRVRNQRQAVREIVKRIAALESPERDLLLRQLLIFGGFAAVGRSDRRRGEENADFGEYPR